jgi:SAM-dependent methyltransferase
VDLRTGQPRSLASVRRAAGRLRALAARLRRALRRRGIAEAEPDDLRAYWEQRAARHGRRSVLNLGHPAPAFDAVTARQRALLLPALAAELRGDERLVLDFGCGPGRFTPDLAALVRGRALGVDPVQSLLELAPAAAGVSYARLAEDRIPLDDAAADVVFVCLVLGGLLRDPALPRWIAELARVLRPGGLLFLVENTSAKPDGATWGFRPVQHWQALCAFAALRHVADYEDLGETISVLAGRSPESPAAAPGA